MAVKTFCDFCSQDITDIEIFLILTERVDDNHYTRRLDDPEPTKYYACRSCHTQTRRYFSSTKTKED